ncbi:hypothetical protein Bca101_019745 [Brassica carinata]
MPSVVPLFPYEIGCCLRSQFAQNPSFFRTSRGQEPEDEIIPRFKVVWLGSKSPEQEVPNLSGKLTVNE